MSESHDATPNSASCSAQIVRANSVPVESIRVAALLLEKEGSELVAVGNHCGLVDRLRHLQSSFDPLESLVELFLSSKAESASC